MHEPLVFPGWEARLDAEFLETEHEAGVQLNPAGPLNAHRGRGVDDQQEEVIPAVRSRDDRQIFPGQLGRIELRSAPESFGFDEDR